MRRPLQYPFNRALYHIPLHADAIDSYMDRTRANFEAIPGCPDDLFDRIYRVRNENPVLRKYRAVYFSPLHMHWVVGTFSCVGRVSNPMPSHVSLCPVFYQGTRAIALDDPKNPPELLNFPIIPGMEFTRDQVAAIMRLFPRLVDLYVHPWGHVSMFFRDREDIEITFESIFLPVQLGGLTYSFEILGQKHSHSPDAMPRPRVGWSAITFVSNTWDGLKRFMNCCGNRKPNLARRDEA
ncbi:hypothetical protein HOY82DRAFT_617490 [Tuber indicum]|nr:hypothetical protein HOY82DRAFT_617490 [Tuber indicum]